MMFLIAQKRQIISQVAWRLVWAVMFCAHSAPWISSWAWLWSDAAAYPLRGVLLTLTQAFFVLKILDVSWLRLPANRRTWISVAVGMALLHSGAMQRAITHQTDEATDTWSVVLVGGGLVAGAAVLERLVRLLDWVRLRQLRFQARTQVHRVLGRLLTAFVPPRYLLLARACRVNRAPPLR